MTNILFFLVCIVLLSSCASPIAQEQACEESIVPLMAEWPTEQIDINTGATSYAPRVALARGFYIAPNQVMTVSHLMPARSKIYNYYAEFDRESSNDLLLLSTPICGQPLVLANQNAPIDTRIVACDTGEYYGEIIAYSNTHAEDTRAISSYTNLQEISGEYAQGESGSPVCNSTGQVVGMIIAVRENSALIQPVDKINNFLR